MTGHEEDGGHPQPDQRRGPQPLRRSGRGVTPQGRRPGCRSLGTAVAPPMAIPQPDKAGCRGRPSVPVRMRCAREAVQVLADSVSVGVRAEGTRISRPSLRRPPGRTNPASRTRLRRLLLSRAFYGSSTGRRNPGEAKAGRRARETRRRLRARPGRAGRRCPRCRQRARCPAGQSANRTVPRAMATSIRSIRSSCASTRGASQWSGSIRRSWISPSQA